MIKGINKKNVWPIIALIALAGLNIAVAQEAAPFTDISEGNKYFVSVKYLKENGLITGYEDGSFQPLKEINRAEALKLLQMAVNPADSATSTPASAAVTSEPTPAISASAESIVTTDKFSFDDIAKDSWYYPYILSAWKKGIVKGYPDGLFHPEQTINIAESLKIVLEQEGKAIPEEVTARPYGDVAPEAWFAPYAQVAKERTLILESRNGGNLYPEKNMNRGDFAELIYRQIQSSKDYKFARATWYSDSLSMQSTANRELYIPTNLTAAHKTLPFNTAVKVTNMANGKSVEVRINDRGPYPTGVDLDLSRSAFETIASAGTGIINVEFSIVQKETGEVPETADTNIIEYGF